MTFRFHRDAADRARDRMIEEQLRRRGIRTSRILEAFRSVPRHLFVPGASIAEAYSDRPLPIGHDQTISQPFIVALMIELVGIEGDDVVLEVGSGSGYATAVLSRLARRVIGIERIEELARTSALRLERLGYDNCEIRHGDGSLGAPDAAPFDAILVSASAPEIPPSLVLQLDHDHGGLIGPVGPPHSQRLVLVRFQDGRETRAEHEACVFVRLIGAEGDAPGRADPDPGEGGA